MNRLLRMNPRPWLRSFLWIVVDDICIIVSKSSVSSLGYFVESFLWFFLACLLSPSSSRRNCCCFNVNLSILFLSLVCRTHADAVFSYPPLWPIARGDCTLCIQCLRCPPACNCIETPCFFKHFVWGVEGRWNIWRGFHAVSRVGRCPRWIHGMRGKQTCISAIKGVFLRREKESPGRAMNRKKEEEK